MSIRQEIESIKSDRNNLRNFGLIVGVVFLGLGLFLSTRFAIILALVGGGLLTIAMLFPTILRPVHKTWMVVGIVLGWIMTNIILSIFFYLILTPFVLLLRLSGKKFLDLKFKSQDKSYWNAREQKTFSEDTFEKQF